MAKNSIAEGSASEELRLFLSGRKFGTILADPPWQFQNRTGKVAPEHRRLSRYGTLNLEAIKALPVGDAASDVAHLYLWGFAYKSNIVWHKIRKDGGPDGRGVGFYFRNVTELLLFGIKGKNARTLSPGRRQVNFIAARKREHSRKPDEQYSIIESCSPGPFLELFSRGERQKWTVWGLEADKNYSPTWQTYSNHSQRERSIAS
jgi:N6-adenosine-specific RNA methylase IME4